MKEKNKVDHFKKTMEILDEYYEDTAPRSSKCDEGGE